MMKLALPVAKSREEVEYLLANHTGYFTVMPLMWRGAGGPTTARVEPAVPLSEVAQEAYRVYASNIDELIYTITSLVAGKPDLSFIEIHAHVPGYPVDEHLIETLYGIRVEEGDI